MALLIALTIGCGSPDTRVEHTGVGLAGSDETIDEPEPSADREAAVGTEDPDDEGTASEAGGTETAAGARSSGAAIDDGAVDDDAAAVDGAAAVDDAAAVDEAVQAAAVGAIVGAGAGAAAPNADGADAEVRSRPVAPNGRRAPNPATSPDELINQFLAAEAVLRSTDATAGEVADAGHRHQVAVRTLGRLPDWDSTVFSALPQEMVEPLLLHVSARRAIAELHSGFPSADFIPAWAIVEPAPLEELRSYYQAAEAATGIEWEYLAAINLLETGMGRIRGLSSAGAQGPMQFLPTTWAEPGIGQGDIDDPGDAIAAAARYLVRRGGPADMPGALWGYNNSEAYVTAVQAYAELLRHDPSELVAIYHWEIYFATDAGDLWLPTGFSTAETMDLDDFLAANPWSAPTG